MTSRNLSKFYPVMMIMLVVAAARPMAVHAQAKKTEITPTISYMWAGSFATFDGDIKLEDGTQYGGIIGHVVAPGVRAELSYATLASRATFIPYYLGGTPSGLEELDVKINIHYFQLGAIHEFDKGKATPFMGFSMGAVLFSPAEDRYAGYTLEDTWRFAVSAMAGVKIELSDVVALRLQGRLFLPIYFSGGGVFVGTGGASVGLSGGIPIVQGDVGAGIAISL